MLSLTLLITLTSLASLVSVQAAKTDCEVLNAGFPEIPATGKSIISSNLRLLWK
jgi:hypothetical protein